MSYAKRTLFGVMWSYLSFLGSKGINLAALIVLARLLGPSEFGLMAICTVVIAYFEIVAKFGLGAALVSAQDNQDEMEAAVCIMSLLSSAAMALAAGIASPFIAGLFNEPSLVWPLRVIALAMVVDAAAVVPSTLLSKRLQFKKKAIPDIVKALIKGAVSIALAYKGNGVWALVLGHVIGTAAASVVSFVINPWWPRVMPHRSVVAQAFRFGRHLLLAEIINSAQRNLDALLVGKLLGPTLLGIYTLAFRLPDLVIRSFNQVTGTVLHPVISAMGVDRAAMQTAYLTSLRYVALVTFPAGVAICIASDAIVRLLYTPEWYGMTVPMQYLSISLALLTVDFVPGILYKAMNRTEFLLWTSILKLPLFVAVLIFAAPWGVAAISAAQIGLSLAYMIPNGLILKRILGIGLWPTVEALRPAVLVSLVVTLVGLALLRLPVIAAWAQVTVLGLGLGMTWGIGLAMAAPEVQIRIRSKLKRRKGA